MVLGVLIYGLLICLFALAYYYIAEKTTGDCYASSNHM